MPTVYIETTIPSYYHETRRTIQVLAWREATRRWWRSVSPEFTLATSQVVLDELRVAPPAKARAGTALLASVPLLDPRPEIAEIIRAYIAHKLVPSTNPADAAHLAFASFHRMDYLLTWNCQHLANVNKARHIAVINRRLGLHIPIITTPLTLLRDE